ncbi:MAG: hypothetical protein PHD15_03495 [Clostridia bacterium]|nr:hypothetical protein [Clostridia bacterium]MDD4386806.1 hypothetical protein [Clostridia bacterium]
MEISKKNKIETKRLSIITDIILFILLLNIFLSGFKLISSNDGIIQNLSLEDVEIVNKNYIESNYIKDKYNINILYGRDSYESVFKVEANIQQDEYKIYQNLTEINKTLKKYPDNFFEGNNLTIILLDKFNNNNIALASRNRLNEFKIYISYNETFERALHHELFHIFEYKLNISKKNMFSSWNQFNPENFEYISNSQNLDDKYIYSNIFNKTDIFFVTKYSKTSEKEDRAEIFAEIMTFKIVPEYLALGSNINKKAHYITDIMTDNLKSSSNTTFYWNRF